MDWAGKKLVGASIVAMGAAALGLGSCAPVEKGGGARPVAPNCAGPDGKDWPQCWSPEERYLWYRGSQGSRLIPEAWLRALEAPNSVLPFLDPAHFGQFGYLTAADEGIPPPVGTGRKCPAAVAGQPRLPIGFARDCQSDSELTITKLRWYKGQGKRDPWIGLNCAACHTTDIVSGSNRMRVDGAPTFADFQGFTDALRETMQKTDPQVDPAKWERFARRVVAPQRAGERNDSRVRADEAMLKVAFKKLLDHQLAIHAFNRTEVVYGHGRLDAVGHILNKVAFNNAAVGQFRGEPDAPVSYPFIWNARQHDFLQWNGIVPTLQPLGPKNVDVGAMVRNTSEVIGVFAELTTKKGAGFGGYRSSVDTRNLVAMEGLLSKLRSPAWPQDWGGDWALNEGLRAKGEELFNSTKNHPKSCAACHAHLDRKDLTTPIKAVMSPVWGTDAVHTDPWMMCNAFSYRAKSGNLRGTKVGILFGDPLPRNTFTNVFLETQAVGVLLENKWNLIWSTLKQLVTGKPPKIEVFEDESFVPTPQEQPLTRAQRLQLCKDTTAEAAAAPADKMQKERRILAYKGRPLNGIWATAPYLHNGSVRSLHQLLLEPKDRDTRFWVGNHEFDPKEVGFTNGKSAQFPYGSMYDRDDPKGRGNSNEGHDYNNAGYSDAERMALVEYMKSL